MDTLGRLQTIIRDVLDDDDFAISRETKAEDHEDWDSLEQINIIAAIEHEFGIKFQLRDLEELKNVGDTVDIIEVKLARGAL